MIPSGIQIEKGPIEDFYKKWGFIYLSGDRRFAAPEKKRDKSSYAEQEGSNEDLRTVDDEFDYKVRFLIETPNKNLVNANSKIVAWNNAIRAKTSGSDVKRCRTVTFYDYYKRCEITGVPDVIETVSGDKSYYRRHNGDVMDCVIVELVIHVNRPSLCKFDVQR